MRRLIVQLNPEKLCPAGLVIEEDENTSLAMGVDRSGALYVTVDNAKGDRVRQIVWNRDYWAACELVEKV